MTTHAERIAEIAAKAAAEIQKVADEAAEAAAPVAVGSVLRTAEQVDALPVGTHLTDKDGDDYARFAEGWSNDTDEYVYTSLDPANYLPCRVTALPEEKPYVAKEGDRVQITARESVYGTAVDPGSTGTVVYEADRDGDVFVRVDDHPDGSLYFKSSDLAPIEDGVKSDGDAPVPLAPWERELLAGVTPEQGFPVGTLVRLLPGATEAVRAFSYRSYPKFVKVVGGLQTGGTHGPLQVVVSVEGHEVEQVVPIKYLQALPKAGDTVRITGPIHPGFTDHVGTVGVMYQEPEVYSGSATGVRFSVKPHWYCGDVELVEAAEEPVDPKPLAVGDRVRVVSVGQYGAAADLEGKEGVIAELGTFGHPDHFRVTMDEVGGPYWMFSGVTISAEQVEAVAPKLAVGDRVRFNGTSWGGVNGDGRLGTVTDADHTGAASNGGYTVALVIDGRAGDILARPSDLELVSPEPEPTPAALPLDLLAKYDDRRVEVRISAINNVKLSVFNKTASDDSYRFAFLTAEMARTVATSLLRAADELDA